MEADKRTLIMDNEILQTEIDKLRAEINLLAKNNETLSNAIVTFNSEIAMNSDLRLGIRNALEEAKAHDLAKSLLKKLFKPDNWVRDNAHWVWIERNVSPFDLKKKWEGR